MVSWTREDYAAHARKKAGPPQGKTLVEVFASEERKEGVMSFTVPYPPSANQYWRMVNGRVLVSSTARRYKSFIRSTLKHDPLSGPVKLTLFVYRPRKSGDLSNRIKVLEDALQGVAYHNDSQVVELHAKLFDDKEYPRVEISVKGQWDIQSI